MNTYIIAVDKRGLAEKFINALGVTTKGGKEFQSAIALSPSNESAKDKVSQYRDYRRIFTVAAENAQDAVMKTYFVGELNAGQRSSLWQQAKNLDNPSP